jgi:hypothetical protein
LIKQLTELEHELVSLPIPAFANLYFNEAILGNNRIPLDSSVDPTSPYGVARSCDRSCDIDLSYLNLNLSHKLDSGPCKYLQSFVGFKKLIAALQGSHSLRMGERSQTEKISDFELS